MNTRARIERVLSEWTERGGRFSGEHSDALVELLVQEFEPPAASGEGLAFYDAGLFECAAPDVDGWAVFSGSEGEDPKFEGFFLTQEDAQAVAEAPHPDLDQGDCLFFDSSWSRAVLTADFGIVAANDYTIDTHEKLRARIAEARKRGLTP